MPRSTTSRIIATGRQRVRRTKHYHNATQRIRAQVWNTYRDEMVYASMWQHLLVRWKIWREIRRACKRLASDYALYLTQHN